MRSILSRALFSEITKVKNCIECVSNFFESKIRPDQHTMSAISLRLGSLDPKRIVAEVDSRVLHHKFPTSLCNLSFWIVPKKLNFQGDCQYRAE